MKKQPHFINVYDFDTAEIKTIFELTKKVKKNPDAYQDFLKGKILGLIFEKPSTRTRISFEVGFTKLGGNVMYLGPDDIQLGVREEVRDIARVLNRYLDAVVLRTFSHDTILEFGEYFSKPVINGLSNTAHPCQAVTDFFTIQEKFGSLKDKKIVYVGDGNNVCNSLLLLAAQLGVDFAYATPTAYPPSRKICQLAKQASRKSKSKIEAFTDPKKAVAGADVVYTDVWVSMGEENLEIEKRKEFVGFQVNPQLMKYAKKTAIIMHCLPAHRGQEISDKAFESKASVVFDQAENRLHVQKAILIYLMGKVRKG